MWEESARGGGEKYGRCLQVTETDMGLPSRPVGTARASHGAREQIFPSPRGNHEQTYTGCSHCHFGIVVRWALGKLIIVILVSNLGKDLKIVPVSIPLSPFFPML